MFDNQRREVLTIEVLGYIKLALIKLKKQQIIISKIA